MSAAIFLTGHKRRVAQAPRPLKRDPFPAVGARSVILEIATDLIH